MRLLAILLVLVPLGAVALTDLEQDQELARLSAVIQDLLQVRLNDTEDLEARVTVLESSVVDLEVDVVVLDQRVDDLEAGGGGSNNADLTERVEALEEVTSQMSGEISELQATTEDFEMRIQELELVIIGPWVVCESFPCENGATCIDVNVDTFICTCRDGYFGVTCAESYKDAIFLAALESTVAGSYPNPIVFTWEVINPGGHYSTETGKYLAPYNGTYEFSANLQDTGTNAYIDFFIDDSNIDTHNDLSFADSHYRSVTLIQELTAGQTVHLSTGSIINVLGSSLTLTSYFGGHLISAN